MARNTAKLAGKNGAAIALAGALLVWLMTGCAQTTLEQNSTAKDVLAEGIEALDDRYINPVQPDNIMMAGLAKLSSIDESLTVTRTSKSVFLEQDGGTVTERPLPDANNIHDWSELGANILLDARRTSTAFLTYSQEELLKFVFQGLVSGLDRYSRYLSPEDARNSRASREGFGGIGVQIDQVDGEYVVRSTFPDHPAVAAGLQENDRITHIEGRAISGLALLDVVNKLRGRVGEAVKITFVRTGSARSFDRSIIRDYIVASTVNVRQKDKILEVTLSGFNTGTVGELRRAIVKTAREIGPGLRGIMLDLQGNPGGLLDQAIAVSDLFLSRGRIISTKGRHPDSNQLFDASPGEVLPGVPMVVVVNGRSASAAEIVAVALRDAGRAAIVGSTSFGKGSVQTIVRLPNNAELNITWARIFAPSGQTLDSQGIVPAICTNVTSQQITKILTALASRGEYSDLTPAKLRIQARQPHYSAERRKACMPTDRRASHDLQAARLLLTNRGSYAAATNRLAPTLAKRLPNNRGSHIK
jgi:carboxyl-terminal processing protease